MIVKFRQSTLVGLPEKILHFTITETLQVVLHRCFQPILINVCCPKVMHIDETYFALTNHALGKLHNFAEWSCKFADWNRSRGCHTPPHPPLAPGLSELSATYYSRVLWYVHNHCLCQDSPSAVINLILGDYFHFPFSLLLFNDWEAL